jgi:hypothetical protein
MNEWNEWNPASTQKPPRCLFLRACASTREASPRREQLRQRRSGGRRARANQHAPFAATRRAAGPRSGGCEEASEPSRRPGTAAVEATRQPHGCSSARSRQRAGEWAARASQQRLAEPFDRARQQGCRRASAAWAAARHKRMARVGRKAGGLNRVGDWDGEELECMMRAGQELLRDLACALLLLAAAPRAACLLAIRHPEFHRAFAMNTASGH